MVDSSYCRIVPFKVSFDLLDDPLFQCRLFSIMVPSCHTPGISGDVDLVIDETHSFEVDDELLRDLLEVIRGN